MRITWMMVPALLLTAPAMASAGQPTVTVVSGGGALVEFSQTSADGCTETTGQLVVLQGHKDGEQADGVYVVGVQADLCGGTYGNGFAGYAPLTFSINGLEAAHATGSLIAPSYSGGADVAVDLDLTWNGSGAVVRQGGRYHDENILDFSWGRARGATTSGSLSFDGDDATITSASLIAGVSGSVYR